MTVNTVVIVELSVGGTFIPGPSKSSKNYIPEVQIFFSVIIVASFVLN